MHTKTTPMKARAALKVSNNWRIRTRLPRITDHAAELGILRPHFANKQDAVNWMYEMVDDPCVDNDRFAFEHDEKAMSDYGWLRDNGCCGSFDANIIVDDKLAVIGCNYGH